MDSSDLKHCFIRDTSVLTAYKIINGLFARIIGKISVL